MEDYREIWPEIANSLGTQLVHIDCNSDVQIQTFQPLKKETPLLTAIRNMKTTKSKSQPIWSSCVRFPFRQEVCYNNKDNDDTEDYPISSSDDSDEESENETDFFLWIFREVQIDGITKGSLDISTERCEA